MVANKAAWRPAARRFALGFRLVRRYPGAYGLLTALFVPPALIVAALTVLMPQPNLWQNALLYLLRSLTVVLGAVTVMVVVAYHAQGRAIGVPRATWLGLRWVCRYLWTNAHTSLIFWLPVSGIVWVSAWQAEAAPLGGSGQPLMNGVWWAVIGGVALAIHTRTLLAPFLAVHGDLPGTLAALESWRLSGRSFWGCLSTLALAAAPVALPFGVVCGGLLLALPAAPQATFLLVLPDLAWAAIQLVRPLLIPAVYVLYTELWDAERARRATEGTPPPPAFTRPLLALTKPLPHTGRWE